MCIRDYRLWKLNKYPTLEHFNFDLKIIRYQSHWEELSSLAASQAILFIIEIYVRHRHHRGRCSLSIIPGICVCQSRRYGRALGGTGQPPESAVLALDGRAIKTFFLTDNWRACHQSHLLFDDVEQCCPTFFEPRHIFYFYKILGHTTNQNDTKWHPKTVHMRLDDLYYNTYS